MSTTYPDIDVTDPQEPDNYDEVQDDYYIEFCKEREQEAIEAQEAEYESRSINH